MWMYYFWCGSFDVSVDWNNEVLEYWDIGMGLSNVHLLPVIQRTLTGWEQGRSAR